MFIGAGPDGQKVKEGKNGLWAIDAGTPQYRAWQYWLIQQFNYRTFTKAMTQTGQWPPSTVGAARAYAKWLSDIRDEIKDPRGVPRHPDPWDGVVPDADGVVE